MQQRPHAVNLLILMHICLSLGGLLIHIKIHPVTKSLYFWWASPVNVVTLLIIPYLYSRGATAAWGYLVNAFSVLIGTIGMAYFSILTLEGPITLAKIFIGSTLADIIILWAKIPLAHLVVHEWHRLKNSHQKKVSE